jgi:Fic family protein
VKPIIDNLNSAIRNLKKSVLYLEQLDERLASLNQAGDQQGEEEVNMLDLETKLLVDDFFNPEEYTLDKEYKSYNLMQNAKNEQFLSQVFTNPPTILPL